MGGGWLVVRQEGVVLLQQEDGVPGQGAYGRQEGVRDLVRPRLTADCTWNLTFGNTNIHWHKLLVMMMGRIQRKLRRRSLFFRGACGSTSLRPGRFSRGARRATLQWQEAKALRITACNHSTTTSNLRGGHETHNK